MINYVFNEEAQLKYVGVTGNSQTTWTVFTIKLESSFFKLIDKDPVINLPVSLDKHMVSDRLLFVSWHTWLFHHLVPNKCGTKLRVA